MKFDALFFSPHLDDAVLSAGGIIAKLISENKKVCVITVFTQGSDAVKSKDSKDFIKKCYSKTSFELFKRRKIEDIKALKYLDCNFIHLDFIDALFRVNKFKLVYPNYKAVFSGKISSEDERIISEINNKLKIIKQTYCKKNYLLWTPIGIGNHVDHIIVYKTVISVFGTEVFFWEDIPYRNKYINVVKRLNFIPKEKFRLERKEFNNIKFAETKKNCLKFYKTQLRSLLQNGLMDIDYFLERSYQIKK